jgi:transcriptional regulator with XRE-family HTH domain
LRERVIGLGDKNIVGPRIEKARKKIGMKQNELLARMQIMGFDMNASALSKIEGKQRHITDKELNAFITILGANIATDLYGEDEYVEEGSDLKILADMEILKAAGGKTEVPGGSHGSFMWKETMDA